MRVHAIERADDERVNWPSSIPMFAIHGLCLLAIVTGVTWQSLVLCAVLYFGRMWFITAGFHRYFAHRSYKTNRVFQFVLAFGGGMPPPRRAPCGGPATTATTTATATPSATSTPLRRASGGATSGWILCDKNKGWDPDAIQDFNKYPELRFLTKHDWIPPWTVGVASYLIGGWQRPDRRLLLVDRAAVARHLHRELAGPRHGSAPLRHHRHQPELRPHRPRDRRRGLAQQPPLLPVVGPPRLLLVGVRRHLLRPQGACAWVGLVTRPQDPARAGARPRPGCATAPSTSACSRPTGARPPPTWPPTSAGPTAPTRPSPWRRPPRPRSRPPSPTWASMPLHRPRLDVGRCRRARCRAGRPRDPSREPGRADPRQPVRARGERAHRHARRRGARPRSAAVSAPLSRVD